MVNKKAELKILSSAFFVYNINYFTAIVSISTITPNGKSFTAYAALAGHSSW